MRLKYLEWDSNFFGRKIYAVTASRYDPTAFTSLISEAKLNDADLVYIFSNPDDQALQLAIRDTGAVLYDSKITYHKMLEKASPLRNEECVKEYNQPPTEQLFQLAIDAGNYSRFKSDQRLSPRFTDMYKLWLNNSIQGKLADKVFVAKQEELIAGFITCKRSGNVGSIGLIAVNELLRGMKFGHKLIETTENWYRENEVDESTVVTQTNNTTACSFYEKEGYSMKSLENVFHLWIR